jgi:hypothetical protein
MRALSVAVISLVCAAPAFGQAHNPDDLQPGVNTSAMPAQPPSAAAAPTAPSAPAPVATAPAPGKTGNAAPAATPGTGATATAKGGAPAAAAKTAKAGKSMDRLDLDTTQITGNKELPKVMYVVPWKRADLGDLTGKPANSLVDEVLQPVDRDVFNREERYYHTVAPEKSSSEAPVGAPAAH